MLRVSKGSEYAMKTRRNKRSRNGGERNAEEIPLDLVFEILKRLPAKSIARFRCVSKLVESTLRSSNFTDSFFSISSSRPKLLFTCSKNSKTFFYSSVSTQHLNPSSNPSPIATNSHMKFSDIYPFDICRPVHGFVCGKIQRIQWKGKVTVPVICNPSTGQSLTLPRVKTTSTTVISYLGYDPINQQFKVLCMSQSHIPANYSHEHQVLTLGTRSKLSWRMIECDIPHRPLPIDNRHNRHIYDGMCINGVCYYLAWVYDDKFFNIVCFDIRSENFKCIRGAKGMQKDFETNIESTLVNYKGKLATITLYQLRGSMRLWVLEDAEENQWSIHTYFLPHHWKHIVAATNLHFVGMTSAGEIVLSPTYIFESFYLLYYNPDRRSITKVEIQGMESVKYQNVYTFLDHVEDVKLMASC